MSCQEESIEYMADLTRKPPCSHAVRRCCSGAELISSSAPCRGSCDLQLARLPLSGGIILVRPFPRVASFNAPSIMGPGESTAGVVAVSRPSCRFVHRSWISGGGAPQPASSCCS